MHTEAGSSYAGRPDFAESLPIRLFFSVLTALLLAIALAVGGYCLLLAWQRSSTTVTECPAWPTPSPLAAAVEVPTKEPRNPTFLPASAPRLQARRTLTVVIANLPAELPRETAGVATFVSTTGADFRWAPLRGALTTADGRFSIAVDAGTLSTTVTLAATAECARHGYLARLEIPAGDRATTATLDAAAATVEFMLPTGATFAGPFCLHRSDDEAWLSMSTGSSGLCLKLGNSTRVLLGAGSYRLCDPLLPQNSMQFDVPATRAIALSPALARARADRP